MAGIQSRWEARGDPFIIPKIIKDEIKKYGGLTNVPDEGRRILGGVSEADRAGIQRPSIGEKGGRSGVGRDVSPDIQKAEKKESGKMTKEQKKKLEEIEKSWKRIKRRKQKKPPKNSAMPFCAGLGT
ncbi:MAG: hypothetical protein Q8O83_02345 [bacterium]|nr:hypothetical protein [bacterium]